MICLGMESTAHTFGVGIVSKEGAILANQRKVFVPPTGGIHPREAAEHHEKYAQSVIKEALEQVEDKSYDLIFADFEINEENTTEMLQKMTSFQPEAKIIILSALTRQQIESQLDNLNIFSIIEKPFRSEQIKSIVKEALFPLEYEIRVGNRSEAENSSENKPK